MASSRWRWVGIPDAEQIIDEKFKSWARAFLGGHAWNNWAVATSELGWSMSGFDRAVCATALRRARLWRLRDSDLYRHSFEQANTHGRGWAHQSRVAMTLKGILDWPEWKCIVRVPSLLAYKAHVVQRLVAANANGWREKAASHTAQVPYTLFQPSPSKIINEARRANLPWQVQLTLLSWCRLRAGLIILRHRNGRRSTARYQSCIFCGMTIRNATVHTLSCCSHWTKARADAISTLGLETNLAGKRNLAMLGISVGRRGFHETILFAGQIDREATEYWARAGGVY